MKKFQLNKQKLKNLTTPLLALSLMVGCVGVFGGSASAASITNNVVLAVPKPIYGLGDLLTSISSTSAPFIATPALPEPAMINQTYDAGMYINNPCTATPVDISTTVTMQTNSFGSGAGQGGDENVIFVTDGTNTNFSKIIFTNVNQDFVGTTSLSGITAPQMLVDLTVELAANLNPANTVKVSNLTYTLTYPDNMPDCTYPATNNNPTISPSTVTIPSTTTSGSTVVPGSSLSATDTDGDTLSYSITAGNGGGYFAIDSTTGDITTTSTNIPAGTYTITVQVDDGNGGIATADVTITVTASTTPALYCPSPYSTTTLLTPSGDCDGDGITNQTEGYDPDSDGNPSTGTAPVDTDSDGKPDYLDLDTDNDGILDIEEKGTATNNSTNPIDTDSDGTPDFRDIDSDNDSTTDLVESGRNFADTNNDGRVDGMVNTYGIASSAASTTDPKTTASSSLQDSNNNGTPDYREAATTATTAAKVKTNLANTGQSLKAITIVATMALGLAGYVKVKNSKRGKSYRRR